MRWPICFAFLSIAFLIDCRTLAADLTAGELAREIDRLIEARLRTAGVPVTGEAHDAEFLRRVHLDLHGTVPTAEQAGRFLTDKGPDRRTRLVDALLTDKRYGDHLGDIWQGYLISPLADDRRARSDRLRRWLADAFNTRSWDRIAADLLTATGKLDENPATVYLVEGRLPRTVPDLTDLATRYFLGIRLNCAQCHDHPFTKWTQQDYWGMAAFFTQVQTPGRSKLVYQVGVKDYPDVTLATLKADAPDGFIARPPTFLGGDEMKSAQGVANRQALVDWMVAPKNPYFALAMVNRTWQRLFGRGIVDPVDDMHADNSPSHPELLNLLAARLVDSGYDLKFLTRAIVLSKTYQRTSKPGDASEKQANLFGRMPIKVLSAGQLYDSLVTVLGPPSRTKGPSNADPRPEFIEFFADNGDPDPTAYRRGIPHLLRQMNSEQFAGRNVAALAARVASADEPAGELFLAVLSRRPTAEEQKLVQAHLARSASKESACRDLVWALLMTSEFSLNH